MRVKFTFYVKHHTTCWARELGAFIVLLREVLPQSISTRESFATLVTVVVQVALVFVSFGGGLLTEMFPLVLPVPLSILEKFSASFTTGICGIQFSPLFSEPFGHTFLVVILNLINGPSFFTFRTLGINLSLVDTIYVLNKFCGKVPFEVAM